MASKMTLEQYRKAIGLTVTMFAQEVTKASGGHISNQLIEEAEHYLAPDKEHERIAMAKPKADAIAKFISSEMGRSVSVSDLGLKVI